MKLGSGCVSTSHANFQPPFEEPKAGIALQPPGTDGHPNAKLDSKIEDFSLNTAAKFLCFFRLPESVITVLSG